MTVTEQLADVISAAVHEATAPLLAKIAALEARPVIAVDVLELLKEQASDLRTRMVAVESRAATPGPAGIDGKDGMSIDPAIVDVMVAAQVERAVKAIPVPRDGKDGAPGPKGEIGPMGPNGPQGEQGSQGLSGKDADPLAIVAIVDAAVTKAMAVFPKAQDGQPGRDGTSIRTGLGPPSTDGRSGDTYIDVKTGDVYQCH